MCSYRIIMSSPGKFICALITSKPPGKFDVFSRNIIKKVTPEKKRTDILAK